MDAQASGEFVNEIRRTAAGVAGVKRTDKLWVRKSGLEYLVDIHIQVAANSTVHEGHRISHLVKDQLLDRFTNVRDVLVHLEALPPRPRGDCAGFGGAVNRPVARKGVSQIGAGIHAVRVFALSLSVGLALSIPAMGQEREGSPFGPAPLALVLQGQVQDRETKSPVAGATVVAHRLVVGPEQPAILHGFRTRRSNG